MEAAVIGRYCVTQPVTAILPFLSILELRFAVQFPDFSKRIRRRIQHWGHS
jgi:hypothetical protein